MSQSRVFPLDNDAINRNLMPLANYSFLYHQVPYTNFLKTTLCNVNTILGIGFDKPPDIELSAEIKLFDCCHLFPFQDLSGTRSFLSSNSNGEGPTSSCCSFAPPYERLSLRLRSHCSVFVSFRLR